MERLETVAIMTAILSASLQASHAAAQSAPGAVPRSPGSAEDIARQAWGLYYATQKTAGQAARDYGGGDIQIG